MIKIKISNADKMPQMQTKCRIIFNYIRKKKFVKHKLIFFIKIFIKNASKGQIPTGAAGENMC